MWSVDLVQSGCDRKVYIDGYIPSGLGDNK